VSVIFLFLALVAALGIIGAAGIARQRIREHGPFVLAWRWLTGEPHHGRPLTDAGWNRPGTKAFTQTGHARRWWYRPRWHRTAARSGSTFFALLMLWGLLYARTATLATLLAVAVLGLVLGVWASAAWFRAMKHRRTWIDPAHLVAAPLVGLPVASSPAAWLSVAVDRSLVVAELPPAWQADAALKARLVDVLSSKLAIEAPQVRWQLAGPKPRLEITQSAPPPALVPLADVMPAIKDAKPDELVWGIGKRGAVVKSSLSGDSPHVGLSMGSGAGKSITARSLLAQMLHRGAIGLVLDIKWISHMWADGLPNVAIARRPAEIHAALLWLGREVGRRNEVALAGADIEGHVHATVGPRLIVIGEEMNATANALRAYWKEVRTKDDPARSPALDALDGASFMGRQVLANLIYIGQRLSAKAVGSGDARENIGVIAFARYSASNWKMLAGDFPMPPKNLTPGRLQVVSDTVREAQGIKMTAGEARELALSGVVSPLPSTMPGARATGDTGTAVAVRTGPDLHGGIGHDPNPVLPVSGTATLREAVEAGIFGRLSLAGVRTARQRDEAFPSSVGLDGAAELYELAALVTWAAGRRG